MPQLLTVDQVATRLQVPRTWVYKRVAADAIPHLKIGRYVRFEEDAVSRWLEEQTRANDPACQGRRLLPA